MITSNKIIEICEEWVKSYSASGRIFSIYENPTSSDLVKLTKEAREDGRKLTDIRFIANHKDRMIYIVDGYHVLHEAMRAALQFGQDYKKTSWLLEGMGKISSNKINMYKWDKFEYFVSNKVIESDAAVRKCFGETLNYNWSWVDQYIGGCSSVMDKYKNWFAKIVK